MALPPPPKRLHTASQKLSGGLTEGSDAGNMAKENREDLFAANEVSASADGVSQAPPTAPREYVVSLYNSYAETFDSHLQGALSYRTPTVVVETLSTLFPRRRQASKMIT